MKKSLEEFKKLHEFYKNCPAYQTSELAEYLSVSTRTIQRWIKEKTAPSDDQIKKIQAYLDNKKASQNNTEI